MVLVIIAAIAIVIVVGCKWPRRDKHTHDLPSGKVFA